MIEPVNIYLEEGNGRSPRKQRAMKLLIAIPALNEEEAIESTILRSLEARSYIIANSPVSEVDITVVSDGSTDRTVEIASRYTDRINLIVFEKNRGYGAAIKEAWMQSDAEALGFLDADGTCDPNFFANLCAKMDEDEADVVLGCRLTPGSKMPAIRRIGNGLFATLLTALSSRRVKDTASGMRVIRRSSLPDLMPLPDGLHFTPAMSARAILSDSLNIVEIPMPYHERQGESKLKVGKDGLRFLRVIMQAAFLYRPSRPLGIVGALLMFMATALMLHPAIYWGFNHKVQEWMIYRFVVSDLLGASGLLMLSCAFLCRRMVSVTLPLGSRDRQRHELVNRYFSSRWCLVTALSLMLIGGCLVWPSFMQLIYTGAIYEHWSRFVAMSFFFQAGFIIMLTAAVNYCISLIGIQLDYLKTVARDSSKA